MRVFMTAVCRSAVTTSRLDTALDMASSPLLRPNRTRRLRTNTSSPTMFMISSSRAVSTRTVVSASLATGLSATGATGRAAALVGVTVSLAQAWGRSTSAALAVAGAAGVAGTWNLPLPCSSSSRASNSCSLM
ncbi:hypothetical protein D9M73_206700 [compost metagenome]